MDALYAPLSEFFLQKFGSVGSTNVIFRFDRFGSKVSQDDFRINPLDPNSPFSAAVARERISDLANRIAVDNGDGSSVTFLADTIDAVYEQMLQSAQPHLPAEVPLEQRQTLVRAFGSLKDGALRLLEKAEMTSLSGLPLGYRLTDFTPTDWYDLSSSEVWTSHSLTVRASEQTTHSPPITWRPLPSKEQLDDMVRRAAIPRPPIGGVRPVVLPHSPIFVQPNAIGRSLNRTETSPVRVQDTPQILMKRGLPIFDAVQRLRFKEALISSAPAVEVTTSEVKVVFDYTLVSMTRRWLEPSFLNADTWEIPGQARGHANQSGRAGSLSFLPLAFLVVRNLSISAIWSEADRSNLKNAMSWGPFEVVQSAGAGTVAQPGLQIVGWVLQTMPPLPPCSWETVPPEPDVDAAAERTYTVQEGDTLRKIATMFYGDPNRFSDIQHANDITDPNRITVGQVLKLP